MNGGGFSPTDNEGHDLGWSDADDVVDDRQRAVHGASSVGGVISHGRIRFPSVATFSGDRRGGGREDSGVSIRRRNWAGCVILILFTGKSAGVGAWALWMTEDGVELNFCD